MVSFTVRLAVTAVFFAIIWFAVDTSTLWKTLSSVSSERLILSVLIILSTIPLFAVRWLLVNQLLGISLPLKQSILATAASYLFNQGLPSTLGADGYRFILIKGMGHDFSTVVSSIVLDRATGIMGLLLLITLGQPFMILRIDNPVVARVSLGIQVVLLLGLLAVRFSPLLLPRIQRLKFTETIGIILGHLNSEAEAKRVTWMVLISFVGQIGVTSTVYLIGLGLGLRLDLLTVLFIFPPIHLLSMLPITIAGWGIREGSMVAALAALGVAASDALALSVLFGFCMFAVGIVGGLIWLPTGAKLSERLKPSL